MARTSRIVASLSVMVLAASCGGAKEKPADTIPSSVSQRSSQPPRTPVPGDVEKLAKTYQFAAKMSDPIAATARIDQTGNNKAVRKSEDPGLTFARAEKVTGTSYPTDQEVLLKIHADRAYPGLGIYQGDNYLWRDRSDPAYANWTVWIVSISPPKVVQLKRDSGPYASTDYMLSHLVREDYQVKDTTAGGKVLTTEMIVFGACVDDQVCKPSGHCGYTQ